MNKKFLSVVLFGALMVGSSVTFTGCIDNDEPAGIADLRGAKSELIRANAAYKLAEVEIRKIDIERQQVLLEREKIDMEVQKLDLEIKKASSAYDIAYWEQQKAFLLEDYKAKIFDAQKRAAENEADYLKALADLKVVQATVTDEKYADKLGKLIADLESERSNIKDLNNELFDLTQDLLAFSSNKYEAVKATAESDLKNKESKLENMQTILTEVEALKKDFGTEAINAQILELDKKIAKIDEQVASLKSDLIKVIGTATEPEQLYSRQEVLLEIQNKNVAFEVPAAIQKDFVSKFVQISPAVDYNGLRVIAGNNWNNLVVDIVNTDGTLKANPNITELALGNVTSPDTVKTVDLLSTKAATLSEQVKLAGVRAYAKAYENVNTGFTYGLGSLSESSNDIRELTAGDLAKGKAALAQVEKDVTTAQTNYDNDVTAFEAAVKAYQKDAEAYGIGLQLKESQEGLVGDAWQAYTDAVTDYADALAANADVATKKTAYDNAKAAYDAKLKDDNATNKDVADAKKAMDDAKKTYDDAAKVLATPAATLAAAYKTLQTKLAAYYPLRKNLCGDTDDFVATVTGFNDGKEFKFSDKISSLTEEQFAVAKNAVGKTGIVGGTYADFTAASDKTGSLPTWLKSSKKLYGGAGTIASSEQIVKDLATIQSNSNVVVNPTVNGSAKVLVTLKEAKEAFSNFDSWNTLATAIEGVATATAKTETPIVSEIKKQSEAIKAIYEPYRDSFYELCALDNDMFTDPSLANVKTNLNITSSPNSKGEKQTLKDLRTALQGHANSNSVNINFVEYTDADLTLGSTITTIQLTEMDLSAKIDILEKNISYLGEYIAAKKDDIKKLEDGTMDISAFITQAKKKIENDIAFKEEQIKNAQERFDALNKAKDALIAEFAGSAE